MATQRQQDELISLVDDAVKLIYQAAESKKPRARRLFRASYDGVHVNLRAKTKELCTFGGKVFNHEWDAIEALSKQLQNIASSVVETPNEAAATVKDVQTKLIEAIKNMPLDDNENESADGSMTASTGVQFGGTANLTDANAQTQIHNPYVVFSLLSYRPLFMVEPVGLEPTTSTMPL